MKRPATMGAAAATAGVLMTGTALAGAEYSGNLCVVINGPAPIESTVTGPVITTLPSGDYFCEAIQHTGPSVGGRTDWYYGIDNDYGIQGWVNGYYLTKEKPVIDCSF